MKKEIQDIPLDHIMVEEGAEDLLRSPNMKPYMGLARVLVKGEDPKPALDEIAKLPMEKRYVWRIVSALKWAFVDFDDVSVSADIKTMSAEDLAKIHELLRLRPTQFGLLWAAVFGRQEAQSRTPSEPEPNPTGTPGTLSSQDQCESGECHSQSAAETQKMMDDLITGIHASQVHIKQKLAEFAAACGYEEAEAEEFRKRLQRELRRSSLDDHGKKLDTFSAIARQLSLKV